jgi:hypothetical protein
VPELKDKEVSEVPEVDVSERLDLEKEEGRLPGQSNALREVEPEGTPERTSGCLIKKKVETD